MKVINVSAQILPSTAIALMGESARNCWFYLSHAAAKHQAEAAEKIDCDESHCFLRCAEKEGFPEITMDLVTISEDWKFCKKINSKIISFTTPVRNPEETYLITLEGK